MIDAGTYGIRGALSGIVYSVLFVVLGDFERKDGRGTGSTAGSFRVYKTSYGGHVNSRSKPKAHEPEETLSVVGIGASAGGLYSLECFLSALPEKFNFPVVFVQHLPATHKNLLPELLRARRSDLEIEEASDGLPLLPGRLYLAPAAKEITIEKGKLKISPYADGHIHLPIDEFFVSLARYTPERATAVVFSGAGTDGALGAQTLREAGGTVFVQDPETAEFGAMPLAAISAGQVDGVLSPQDIAREIVRLHGEGALSGPGGDLVTARELEPFFGLIHKKTGYRFNHYKKSVVARRIRRRMYLRSVPSVKDYLDMVAHKEGEAAMLAADLMIGVTSFFRDQLAWKALHLDVTRKIIAEESDAPIRVWTPACATGEEAYSIAMMLEQELELAGRMREVQVFATDVNERALDKAREGVYPSGVTADVPAEYMKEFFSESEDHLSVVINKDLRQKVVFAKHDILVDPPFSRLDLVICRNLLIYLETEAQEKCMSIFHYALKENGYLFLGNAESPGRDTNLFAALPHKKCRVYRKMEVKPPTKLPFPPAFAAEQSPLLFSGPQKSVDSRQSAVLFIQNALLEEYAPAAVAINGDYDIVYLNGPTHRFLRQPRGVPTLNLLELLHERLRNRIRAAVYRVVQEKKPVSVRTGIPDDGGRRRPVTIRVSGLKENLLLIVFREKNGVPGQEDALSLEATAVEETAMRQLENELSTTRDDLRSNIEQLRSLNEELHSSNEELQAANEELETSREELQSLNEELITVNAQLQAKIEEQEATNNDLNNFLASADIPTIFLDHRLRVRRFTPAMTRLIKLVPRDAGRPISDFSQENLGGDIVRDAGSVLEHLSPVRKELQIGGVWYVRTALPYRTSDNRIEGVVISFADITESKLAEENTRHLASFPSMNPNPVIEIDAGGKVIFHNPATDRILEDLGMSKDSVEVFFPHDLKDIFRNWDGKQGTNLLRTVKIKDRIFGESVFLHPGSSVARIYAFEVTERERAEEALRQNEKRMNAAQEIAHLGGWELDLVSNHLSWSDEVYRIFGFTPGEFDATYEAFLEVVHPDDRAVVYEAYSRSLREGRDTYEIEHRVIRRSDGEVRIVHEKCEHVRDGSGRIIKSIGMVHDITEAKQGEEILRKSLERLDIISSTASQLLMSREPQKIVESLCRRVMEHLDCHAFFNYLVDEGGGYLTLNAYAGIPEENAREIHVLTFGTAVCGCAARDACRIVAEHIPTTPDIRTDLVRSFGIKAYACHPLLIEGQVIGTLSFGTKTRLTFEEDELSLMKNVADQVATAMERMKLLHSQKERADELQRRVEERTAELARQAGLLDLAHDAIIVRDEDGRIGFWSSGAEDTYGWTREEALGRITHTLLETRFPFPLTEIDNIIRTKGRWEGELRHTTKAGKRIVVLSRWAVRPGVTPGSHEIMEINCDITDRKHAEEILRVAGEYNRSLLEVSLDPLVTIDREGRISDVNKATENVTGYSREVLIGKDFSDYFTDPEKAKASYELAFREGLVRDYELSIRHQDGHVTPVFYNASVYKDASGKVAGVFAAARDVTEQRRLEEHLRQSHKMEAIGTLAGGIAHDFNNILASILGYTEMAVEDVPDRPEVEKNLRNVLKSAVRARDLVKQILAFSRKSDEVRNPLSLSPLIEETVQFLRASIPTTIDIRLGMSAGSDTVVASPTEVHQILMNLCTNAASAMEEGGGVLDISLAGIEFGLDPTYPGLNILPGKYVRLSVRDTGAGMTKDIIKRVFEPFFTTKEVGRGTGMGLAVVYGIVKDLHGAITVESEPGTGSVFHVFLPLVEAHVEEEHGGADGVPRGSERILFVDDEDLLMEWGQATLERLGYKVTTTAGSAEALAVFSKDPSRFDLVITDQTMPVMTGVQLAARILSMRSDVPIILCTGHSETVSPDQAKTMGIREFLMKPVTRQELAHAVRRALDR